MFNNFPPRVGIFGMMIHFEYLALSISLVVSWGFRTSPGIAPVYIHAACFRINGGSLFSDGEDMGFITNNHPISSHPDNDIYIYYIYIFMFLFTTRIREVQRISGEWVESLCLTFFWLWLDILWTFMKSVECLWLFLRSDDIWWIMMTVFSRERLSAGFFQ